MRNRSSRSPAGWALLSALSSFCCAPAGATYDLLGQFEYAEVLPQAANLPFLVAQPLLAEAGWQLERTDTGEPLLWMQGTAAALRVPLATQVERELVLRARCSPVHENRRLLALVSWNGAPLARLRLEHAEKEFNLRLPAAIQRSGENELRFEVLARRALPRRTLAVSSLEVRQPGRPGGEAIPARSARGLWLPPGATIAFSLRQDSPPQLRLQARAGAAGAELQASLDGAAPRATLARLALAPGHARLVQETLACPPDEVCRLELASLGEGGIWIEELSLRVDRAPRPPRASLPGRPNVVVFLVDALRADFLGAYGHPAPTSPRFDAFAREAVLFEDASAQSSWTRPAVASLFTGLGVEAHGVSGLSNVLVPEITTLAEAFRSAGYATGAFVANGVVSRQLGFDQGFATWNGRALSHKPAAAVVEAALGWAAAQREPFFLYVHTLEPHRPYRPAAEHWEPFLFDGYAGSREPWDLLSKRQLEPAELRFLRSAYEGEVRQSDAAFGAFLDGLRERALLDASLIAFTADHGEEFFEHGGHGHSGTLYREVLHIPLAIRLPAGSRAFREPTPVQQIDVAPTLLALAGVPAPPELEGRDLSARSLGRVLRREEPALLLSRVSYANADKLAARVRATKLVVNLEQDRLPRARLELYDLRADPRETRNLAADKPLLVRYLLTRAAMLRSAQAAVRSRLRAGREVPMSAEQEEQLRALGYIQ